MKILPKFPTYASGNCDFVTKRTKLEEGDKVVLLDVEAQVLPVGMLCMHSSTVKMIVDKLGWELLNDESRAYVQQLTDDLEDARVRLEAYSQLSEAIELLTELKEMLPA